MKLPDHSPSAASAYNLCAQVISSDICPENELSASA